MAKTGRPITKQGKAAAASRASSRKSYQSKTPAEKKAVVANRDSEAQRQADARRLASQKTKRNTYHRNDARATSGVPKGTKCANCGSTTNVQRHVVNGKFKSYLCGRCNTRAIGGKA